MIDRLEAFLIFITLSSFIRFSSPNKYYSIFAVDNVHKPIPIPRDLCVVLCVMPTHRGTLQFQSLRNYSVNSIHALESERLPEINKQIKASRGEAAVQSRLIDRCLGNAPVQYSIKVSF